MSVFGTNTMAPIAALALACAPPPATPHPTRGCPLGVPGTEVVLVDTDEGVDLYFREGNVDEVRRRTRDVAALGGPGAHAGEGHHGAHGVGQRHGLKLMEGPPLRATASDVDGGARLQLIALDVRRRDELRSHVRDRVAKIQSEACE